MAKAVVDSGAVEALVSCLEEFDPSVKESAAWALGYIARHNGDLSQSIIAAGAIPLLVLCIQEPELSLKRIAASALSDVARHSSEVYYYISKTTFYLYILSFSTLKLWLMQVQSLISLPCSVTQMQS